MKFLKVFLSVGVVGIFLSSCEKQTRTGPEFSAPGYWVGNADPLFITMLNRPDGSSRLYLLSPGSDTATAFKYDGVYTATGRTFSFLSSHQNKDLSFSMETGNNTAYTMTGTLTIQSNSQHSVETFPFNLQKQIYQ